MLDLGTLRIGIKADATQAKADLAGVRDEVDQVGESAETLGDKFKSFVGKLAIAAAVAKVAGAIKDVVTESVNLYSEYEQLVGGVETLFGAGGKSIEDYAASVGKSVDDVRGEYDSLQSAQQTVMDNSAKAYRNAGISANEYMEQITSFSASLVSSLGGDTLKAAQVGDMAINDMADNANKMGSSIESIQNAYQGFAKQNYTMLDNLKLGYGGTKEEMERLLADAEKLTGVHYDIDNLSDVYNAIHAVQEEMGITGTTAEEAASTIQGSFGMMQASWTDLLTAMGSGNGFDAQLQNFISSVGTYLQNLMPVVQNALTGLIQAFAQGLPTFVQTVLPQLVSSIIEIVNGAVAYLPTLGPVIVAAAVSLFGVIAQAVPTVLPNVLTALLGLATSAAGELAANLPAILNGAVQMFLGIVNALPQILPQAISALSSLVVTLINQLPTFIGALGSAAQTLFQGIANAIPRIVPAAISAIASLVSSVVSAVVGAAPRMLSAGVQLVRGLISGITSMAGSVVSAIGGVVNSAISAAKNLLGIHSPSRVFAEIGDFTMQGYEEGVEDSLGSVRKTMERATRAAIDGFTPEMTVQAKAASMGDALARYQTRAPQTHVAGGTTNSITVNNYSPKSLSEKESAREFKRSVRQLALAA